MRGTRRRRKTRMMARRNERVCVGAWGAPPLDGRCAGSEAVAAPCCYVYVVETSFKLKLRWCNLALPPDKWSTDYPLSGIYPSRFAAIIRYPSPRKDVYSFPERLRARVLSTRNVI